MSIGVGASGVLGWAEETTSNNYVAPTKFGLLRSETLKYMQATVWRRPLRGIADTSGPIPGNSHIAGDIVIEVTPSQIPLLMKAMRGTIVRTGASAPFTYTFSPTAIAVPAKTLSITVVRNGAVFGYTGCVISSQSYTVDNGMLVATFSIIGRDEASQTAPTPTYTLDIPFGMGEYNLQIPTATAIFDADNFTFVANDNATPIFRLKNTGRGAQFVKYGERTVELTMNRDFFNRTDFDLFKTLTTNAITLTASKSASESITFLLPNAIRDSYDITGLTGQAELIRANNKFIGVYDATATKSYQIAVVSAENVTIP